MPREKTEGFMNPYEVPTIPGTEGWERMYPEQSIIPKERRKEIEQMSIFHERQHWPGVLKPFDVDSVHAPALRGLDTFQHRVFVIPNAKGFFFWIIHGRHYGADIPPYTDPKVIEKRVPLFLQRMIYAWFNWNKIYPKWKRKAMGLLKEQYALYEQIKDLPELEDISHFAMGGGITSGRKLVEQYEKAVNTYLTLFEGYQYTFIGAAYATDMAFMEFCHQAIPDIDDRTIGEMITGAELEAFRPDEEVKRLAGLAVNWGLAPVVKRSRKFESMRSEFEKTDKGKKWLREFEESSFPWFYMMVSEGVFPRSNEPCWLENPDIILGFLKNYIDKIEKGEKIERDVKALKKKKKQIVKENFNKLKTDEERHRFKELYNLVDTFYVFVEEQNIYIKSFAYALFRRNVRKFAEILAKHGVIKEPDDIFYLKFDEIRRALEVLVCAWGPGQPPIKYWINEIEWRKKVIEKFEKWDPPAFLGPWKKPSMEPFVVILGGGISNEILDLYRKPLKLEEVEELKGIGVSAGKTQGSARVIMKAEEISKIIPGEILVCPHTQPAWTPAFSIINGIVTDTGGVMSHAGIVSREYGIPGVMNTYIGTKAIKTGDQVEVDGDEGIVRILSR
ncbi:MAG: PEP-utilizing enzyme [Candidatus Hadarchaeaceae archaeon]